MRLSIIMPTRDLDALVYGQLKTLRGVFPDLYGSQWVKWLVEIEVQKLN